ncbi:MAG TPA: hypothetical protein VF275_03645 [Gammaproteobacteria bacterium]
MLAQNEQASVDCCDLPFGVHDDACLAPSLRGEGRTYPADAWPHFMSVSERAPGVEEAACFADSLLAAAGLMAIRFQSISRVL